MQSIWNFHRIHGLVQREGESPAEPRLAGRLALPMNRAGALVLCALVVLPVLSLTGCASVNPRGNNIRGEVVMPDGTRARNVDIYVYYERTGIDASEGIGPKESVRKIHSRTGSFKTRFLGLLGITGVQAFTSGWESDFYDYRNEPPPRDVLITLHPRRGEGTGDPAPAAADRPRAPASAPEVEHVKALEKAGLSDEAIISHIRSSRKVYHLTTAEILDLKESGVSDAVIDYMINTSRARR